MLKRRSFLLGIGTTLTFHSAQGRQKPSSLIKPLALNGSIAFCYSGPKADGGWGTNHEQGIATAIKSFPKLNVVSIENVPYSVHASRLFRYLVAEGVQMIVTDSNYDNFLRTVSDHAPQVSFLECNGHATTSNLGWFYLDHWYAFYIYGYVAALTSKTNKLGFISSFPIPSVYAAVNAIVLGAQRINPNIQMQVIHVGSWFNPKVTIQAANALCDNQCDVLFGLVNDASYLRVAEKRNVKAILYHNTTPQTSNAYMSSITCDFSNFYLQQLQNRVNGTWGTGSTFLKFGRDYDLSKWGGSVPAEVRRQASELRKTILQGRNPFKGPIYDHLGKLKIDPGVEMQDADLYRWNWAVQGVVGL
ncbi:BMP family ABC transporter substrate-binding protein [Commensalibacter oyaizuii]|uniref:BMP family ABC transporter substrate-binding protein n=1 Tax=Commensalibacter oyaizuii TaxID=3043873 RepID=A0ABT6PZ10_9PROT|nr:BMP family ABC transporter substrate-binding protein [Commensalibacter sp. TBRC 16381]MDI2089973.1 BMP family ABC transporter substrate-binding protein [Commensalibacter sp. TBRC 16381]